MTDITTEILTIFAILLVPLSFLLAVFAKDVVRNNRFVGIMSTDHFGIMSTDHCGKYKKEIRLRVWRKCGGWKGYMKDLFFMNWLLWLVLSLSYLSPFIVIWYIHSM